MKKYMNIIIGCFLIAVSYSYLFLPNNLVPSGIYGLGALLNYTTFYEPAIFLIIVNIGFMITCLMLEGYEETKKYIIPGLLIPILVFIFDLFPTLIVIDDLETIITVIVGSFLTGYGYSLIYKEGYSVGGLEIIQRLLNHVKQEQNKVFTNTIEAVIVILTYYVFRNLDITVYSTIIILVINYMSTKSKLGISSSKTFYIITTKEKEVKRFIIEELNYDFTEFNVKGGYSNQKSKILMAVIDTKDYYKIKEGINLIDPKAFISIIDNYESLNKNKTLRKLKQK